MAESPNILQEPQPDFEKLEMDQLRTALKRSYAERFKMMTSLMKMNRMFSRAKVIHKPFPPAK